MNFQMFKLDLDQIANIHWITEKVREFQKNIHFCFIDYAKAFDCVDHSKLWKILQEVGIPDHLTCLTPQNNPLTLSIHCPFFPALALATTNLFYFQSLWIYLFWRFHVNESFGRCPCEPDFFHLDECPQGSPTW